MFSLSNYISIMIAPTFTPGPNNILSMSNAVKLGLKKGLPFNLGVGVGSFVVSVIITLLSKVLYDYIPSIVAVMRFVGFAYMMYLAFKTYTASTDIENGSTNVSFTSAFFLQFINPKSIVFCTSLITTQLLPYFDNIVEMIPYLMIRGAVSFSGSFTWSLFGSMFKKLFKTHGKIINIIMALLLVYSAIIILMS